MNEPDNYSRSLELHTAAWDPTYGSSEPGIFWASVCHTCGAVVDAAAKGTHDAYHAAIAQ